jgi:hypothetical protein
MDLRARLKAAEVRGGATQPLRDIICEVFGHRNIWGPDQDGRTICAFCHTVLSFGRPARRKAP